LGKANAFAHEPLALTVKRRRDPPQANASCTATKIQGHYFDLLPECNISNKTKDKEFPRSSAEKVHLPKNHIKKCGFNIKRSY